MSPVRPRRDRASLVGETVGNYRIVEILGKGGMGTVYLGKHKSIGHRAAIKTLRPDLAEEKEAVHRFFIEARAANLVKHPGIVEIFDYGESPEAGAYIVMEYLEGESLGARLRREGRLSPVDAARILARVAAALDAAHAHGVLHRDLKPDNVHLVPDVERPGELRPKVLDFGIAKLQDGAGGSVKTQTGMMVGTPAYMSPEYVHGVRAPDNRSDIYALGVIAYELLTGKPPFTGDGYGDVLIKHMHLEPKPIRDAAPDVPLEVERAILRALEKEPDARWQTMADFGAALLEAIGDGPGAAALRLGAETFRAGDTDPGPLGPVERTSRVFRGPGDPAEGRTPSTLSVSAVEISTARRRMRSRRRLVAFAAAAVASGLAAFGILFYAGSGNLDVGVEDGGGDRAGKPDGDRDGADGDGADPGDRARPPGTPDTGAGATTAEAVEDAAGTGRPVATAGARPRTVELLVDSDPQDAEVFRALDGVKVGKTPWSGTYAAGPGEASFVVRKDGYRPATVTLGTERDGGERVSLVRAPATRPATGKKGAVKTDGTSRPKLVD